jgi:hypothetical protein
MARLTLAATLAASYGIYGPAFELMEQRFWEPAHRLYADEATADHGSADRAQRPHGPGVSSSAWNWSAPQLPSGAACGSTICSRSGLMHVKCKSRIVPGNRPAYIRPMSNTPNEQTLDSLVLILDEIPKGPTGKVQRRALKDLRSSAAAS